MMSIGRELWRADHLCLGEGDSVSHDFFRKIFMRLRLASALLVEFWVLLDVRFVAAPFEESVLVGEDQPVGRNAVLAFGELGSERTTMLRDQDFGRDAHITPTRQIFAFLLLLQRRSIVQVIGHGEVVQSGTQITRLMGDLDPVTIQRHNLFNASVVSTVCRFTEI